MEGHEVEIGSFSLSQLQGIRGPWGLKIERDLHFKPITARELWERLTGPAEPYGSYSPESSGTLPQSSDWHSAVVEQLKG